MRFIIAFCLATLPLTAIPAPIPEYDMKAAYLYNLAMFTEWPENAINTPTNNTVRLCILGNDSFGSSLSTLSRSRNTGMRIQLSYLTDVKRADFCQVLFIDKSELKNTESVLKLLENKSILTVTDNEEIFRMGLMVGLFLDKNKLIFDINYTLANSSKINISSKLLKMARYVI
ncbi:YfiR family protein [Methylotenera mobilis]|uniref:YfiR family protein n=1 Tax=Methylotenera mobilis TaxID=359408 RepID=UPI0016513204|nr:YfiR family protein [Methylotenera mobilis]